MKTFSVLMVLCVAAGVAAASPVVTNQDAKSYTLQLDCKHISASRSVQPDGTEELADYKVGQDCKVNVYPYDNPYGKDGHYDLKKRISTAKLKRDSECVIKKGRVTCE